MFEEQVYDEFDVFVIDTKHISQKTEIQLQVIQEES